MSAVDTVERAAKTPDDPQPWAELGLRAEEYQRIKGILSRRPPSGARAPATYAQGRGEP